MLDAASGNELASHHLNDSNSLLWLNRFSGTQGTVADCSTRSGQPRIGVAWPLAARSNWRLLDLRDDQFAVVAADDGPVPLPPDMRCHSVWFRDVTGDGVPERFALRQTGLDCYAADSNQPLWTTELKADHHPRQSAEMPAGFSSLPAAAKAIFSTLAIMVLPIGYIGGMLRRRNWSLARLLVCPAIVMLFLVVWNAPWFQEPGPVALLLPGIAWLTILGAIYVAVTERRDGEKRHPLDGFARWFLPLGSILMFGVLLGIQAIGNQSKPAFIYIFRWRDAATLLLLAVCLSGQFYWLLRILFSGIMRIRARIVT